jgi:lipid A ethanolaminephosphotransferase
VLVYRLDVTYSPLKREIFLKLKTILISLLVIVIMLFSFSKFYTSFFREHKPLRYYTNPTYYIYSIGKYIGDTFSSGETVLKQIGTDATIENTGNAGKRKLVVMVVGEAARADRFSLNGYTRETNPLLKQEKIVNFSNMYSCGTSTAASVPCMFSIYGRSNYSHSKGIETENVLDVLKHTKKVDILWRDNNSNSKGVADRVAYEDFKNPDNNPIPDGDIEPRDTGMLAGLDTYIQKHKDQDILIVLHQMGNHGPAYYKRYPKAFEKFTPVCRTNQLEECSREEIANAYDNAILYTDYFLSKVIEFLKENSDTRETAMIYMSDHGESLGENGLYLHGLPYFMAPDNQKHVAAFIWLGSSAAKNVDMAALKAKSQKKFSHDNLFHTLLGLFEVKTEVYDRKMDILNDPQ